MSRAVARILKDVEPPMPFKAYGKGGKKAKARAAASRAGTLKSGGHPMPKYCDSTGSVKFHDEPQMPVKRTTPGRMDDFPIERVDHEFSSRQRRDKTYELQQGICRYCHNKIVFEKWTIDHRTPLCRGGSNRPDNIIGCCLTCNGAKGPLTEVEFYASGYLQRLNNGSRLVPFRLPEMVREICHQIRYRKK